MPDIEDIDKCTAVFSLKIPEITKSMIDKLPFSFKKKLKKEILLAITRVLHHRFTKSYLVNLEAEFNPNLYLKSD
jgi:hypothetical protein